MPRCFSAGAGPKKEAAKKIEATKAKIQSLLLQAAKLQDGGRKEAAQEARQQAEQLKEQIAGILARRKEDREEVQQVDRTLAALERAMAVLAEQGRGEDAEVLQRLAARLSRERAAGRKKRGGGQEREIAVQQLKAMRIALPALREGERGDLAELLQQAIRAREIVLEGRRDEKAQAIRKRAPSLGNQIEILGLASRLWRKFGSEERAITVGRLAEELGKRRDNRSVDEPKQRTTDKRARSAARGQKDGRTGQSDFRARQRVEEVEKRVATLEKVVAGLRAELRARTEKPD